MKRAKYFLSSFKNFHIQDLNLKYLVKIEITHVNFYSSLKIFIFKI